MKKFIEDKKNAVLLSLFAMILWGSAIPLIKSTYAYLNIIPKDTGSKILVAGIRFFMAGVLSFIYYLIINRKNKIEINKKLDFKFVLILALIQTTLQYIFYYVGLSNTQGSKAAVIQSTNAFFSVIISCLLIKDEHITKKKIVALIIGTLGVLVVNFTKNQDLNFKLTGEGFVIISTIFGALANVFLRKYGKNYDSFLLTASQFLIGSIFLIILGFSTRKSDFSLDPTLFLLLTYGAFISATAFCLWTLVLKYHLSSEFSIYKLFVPVFGTLFSVLILKEEFTLKLLIGLILVFLASYILNRKKTKIKNI